MSRHPLFAKFTAEELELFEAKNQDYSSEGDPMANFKRIAAWMRLYPKMDWATPTAVAILYSMKQIDAALSILERQHEGGVETFDTRAADVSVYWKLARILQREAN
jgi:hypothetical protein